jgi:hypothetical protein
LAISDVVGECVELPLDLGGPFALDVYLESHFNQEGFDPRETP